MLGYTPMTRVVTLSSGQTMDLNITLPAQAVSLSEIVVTGYGQQSAGNITGAVTQVSTEEFNQGRVISPAQLIAHQGSGRPGGGQQRAGRRAHDPDPRRHLGQREQRPALRGRRHAARHRRRRRRPFAGRARPAQLPESGRHPEHHGAAGCVGRGDLRRERGQRRGAHHDEVADRTGREVRHPHRVHRQHVELRGRPAAVDAQRGAVPRRGRAVRAPERRPARQREHQLVRSDDGHRIRPGAQRRADQHAGEVVLPACRSAT